MSLVPVTLPAEGIAVGVAQVHAAGVTDSLLAAYWLQGRDDVAALFLLQCAHSSLAKLADAMGYTITPKADVVEVAA